jgi:hypothetical protein
VYLILFVKSPNIGGIAEGGTGFNVAAIFSEEKKRSG